MKIMRQIIASLLFNLHMHDIRVKLTVLAVLSATFQGKEEVKNQDDPLSKFEIRWVKINCFLKAGHHSRLECD